MSLTEEIIQWLISHQQTLSVIESCTGGGLANEISQFPGISPIFLGSITCYANASKAKILNIPNEIINAKGAVSEEVAMLMADHGKKLFGATWALSTTGIAGPSGGSADKPVGLVWIGLAGPHGVTARKFIFANASRLEHRKKTIEAALEMLKKACEEN